MTFQQLNLFLNLINFGLIDLKLCLFQAFLLGLFIVLLVIRWKEWLFCWLLWTWTLLDQQVGFLLEKAVVLYAGAVQKAQFAFYVALHLQFTLLQLVF